MCTTSPFVRLVFLIAPLLCIIAQKNVLGCDESCIRKIIREQLQDIVVEKLNDIDSKFEGTLNGINSKFEEKLNDVVSKFGEVEKMMVHIDGRFDDILDIFHVVESGVTAMEGRTSESQLNSRDIKRMQTKMDNKISSLVHTVMVTNEHSDRCPGGIFVSTQCFQIFRRAVHTWEDAKEVCSSNNLVMPETSEIVSQTLSRYLYERYGNGSYWTNARGDGKDFTWQRGNMVLPNDMELWEPVELQPESSAGEAVSYCLVLEANGNDSHHNPQPLYRPYDCSRDKTFTLCERNLENNENLKSPIATLNEIISEKIQSSSTLLIQNLEEKQRNIETSLEKIESISKLLPNTGVLKLSTQALEENLSSKLTTLEINLKTSNTEALKQSAQALDENLSSKLTTLEINIKTSNTEALKQSAQALDENISPKIKKLENNIKTSNTEVLKQSVQALEENISLKLKKLETNMKTSDKDALQLSTQALEVNINSELTAIGISMKESEKGLRKIIIDRCPGGAYFGNQCFKLLKDKIRTWTEAKSECQKYGHLAHPYDAVGLRKYMFERYGNIGYAWIGGRGSSSGFKWDHGGATISSTMYWYPGNGPSVGKSDSSYCLLFLLHETAHPTLPYYAYSCSSTRWTLCEMDIN